MSDDRPARLRALLAARPDLVARLAATEDFDRFADCLVAVGTEHGIDIGPVDARRWAGGATDPDAKDWPLNDTELDAVAGGGPPMDPFLYRAYH